MQVSILLVLIIIFVIWEASIALNRFVRSRKTFGKAIQEQKYLSKTLAFADEEKFATLKEDYRVVNPASDYLASCAQNGQQVNVSDFIRLLTQRSDKAISETNSTANILPIIGLMGTFTGIIIGITNIDLHTENISEAIQPLISSAGLAFISSLVALACSAILKYYSSKWRHESNHEIEITERRLLVDYLPKGLGSTTDEVFAKSVRKLELSVRGFSANFDKVTTEFIAEFKPLVEDQRKSNEKTAQHIDSVAALLRDNASVLTIVSDRQKEQVEAVTDVTKKLTLASDALQGSMKLASENLEKFVKLGDDMQQEIRKLNEPLRESINGQKEAVETLKTLYKDLANYNTSIDGYIKSFNSKLDKFGEVGDKVHEVRADFTNFKTSLESILKQITEQALLIQKELKDSFDEYNRSLKSLFADVIDNRREVHMSYYDPEIMKQVEKLSNDNKKMLDSMERYLGTLESSTKALAGTIKSLKGWGFYRVKKDKKKDDEK